MSIIRQTIPIHLSQKISLTDFLIKNNILSTIVSVTVGLVSSDFIKSLVDDIIFPFIILFLSFFNISYFKNMLINKNKTNIHFNFINFIQSFITLIIVILITYFLFNYINNFLTETNETENKNNKN
jgi:large-conductance mechanosensitive channel